MKIFSINKLYVQSLFYISDTIKSPFLDVYNSHPHQNCILQGLTSLLWKNCVIIFLISDRIILNNTYIYINATKLKSVSVKKFSFLLQKNSRSEASLT